MAIGFSIPDAKKNSQESAVDDNPYLLFFPPAFYRRWVNRSAITAVAADR